ncbi:MAG: TolB family protein, partial [Planctomycetota bacterium]
MRGALTAVTWMLILATAGSAEDGAWRTHGDAFRRLGFDKVVFIRRNTCTADHYYTDHVNDRSEPGGNLCVLDLRSGTATELVPELRSGWYGRFDVSFDAKRIVFGWKRSAKEGYRIYEIEVDPSTGKRTNPGKPRQLTFPAGDESELVRKYGKGRGGHWYHHGTDDMHPCYLPDGDIVFVSTRCQFGVLCNNDDVFTTTTLHRMDGDGQGIRKLTNSALSESSPCLMPDGRILYTRWEYVDKGHIGAKCLWAMKPDGTGSVEIYGNDISYPPTFIYGRPIPGRANEFVLLGTPHCFPNSIGTVIKVDTSRNIRTREPMTYMTPQVDIRTEKGFWYLQPSGEWKHDANGTGPVFKDPYPLSDRLFLVAHKPAGPRWDDAKAYGLYLLDDAGEVRLVHDDPSFSCWQPYPLRARQRPPVLRSPVDVALAGRKQAVCVVTDVYHGLEEVERGTIKYIRILEQVPRPWSARRGHGSDKYGKAHVVLSMRSVLGLKVLSGILPVQDDGSAHFVVP